VYKRIEIRNDTLVFIKWAGWTTQFVLYPNTWASKMMGAKINYWRNRIGEVSNMKFSIVRRFSTASQNNKTYFIK
jgi:hypothetical protein